MVNLNEGCVGLVFKTNNGEVIIKSQIGKFDLFEAEDGYTYNEKGLAMLPDGSITSELTEPINYIDYTFAKYFEKCNYNRYKLRGSNVFFNKPYFISESEHEVTFESGCANFICFKDCNHIIVSLS